MSDPELQTAARNIDLLVDALEKIEVVQCQMASQVPSGDPNRWAGDGRFACLEMGSRLCPTCIAHEALETFRGR